VDASRLHFFGAPASICFSHVLGWLDGRDEFEDHVCNAYGANDRPEYLVRGVRVEENRPYEDIENTSADEGEEEGGVTGGLRRNLELEKSNDETEENDVCANDNITHANRPVVQDTTSGHEKAHAQIDDPENIGKVHRV